MKKIIFISPLLCQYIEQLNYELNSLQAICKLTQGKNKIETQKKALELKIAQDYIIHKYCPNYTGNYEINFQLRALIIQE